MARRAWWVGAALLAMAIASATGILGALGSVVGPNRAETLAQLVDAQGPLTTALACVVLVIVLDLVVAFGFFGLLRSVSTDLAAAATALRVGYAMVFLTAAGHLAVARDAAPVRPEDAVRAVDAFQSTWDLGLVVFGLHLILLGVLIWRSVILPRWLGALVIVAGAGYVVDALVIVFGADLSKVGTVTFVGEFALALWLVFAHRRIGRRADQIAA
ncbi:DUF4386 domain-containing protein [Cellulomonas sp. NPDC089187]|uniref:DUF4386 domain-containing protein n=1 Tax=Cellulomonas sp. NPDC089187 TaxID=3154970 RepID=UPI003432CDB3